MHPFHALDNKTILFIGGGNMARAIIDGLLNAKTAYGLSLTVAVSDNNQDKLTTFANKGVTTTTPTLAHTLIKHADVVVLAVKPQSLAQTAPQVAPHLTDQLLISVLAGVSVAHLSRLFGTQNIVRTMPNLPASIGMGATGLFANTTVVTNTLIADQIMKSCGITTWVEKEQLLHAVTAVAGSAPAYFFYVLEHMIAQAISMGLSAQEAQQLATQSMIGAGKLAQTDDPQTLRTQVTSKGGTTAAALDVLNQQQVGVSFEQAMQACVRRSQELGHID